MFATTRATQGPKQALHPVADRAFEVPTMTRWLPFAGAAALGVFSHLTMLFVIAGQGAAHFLHVLLSPGGRRKDRGRGLLAGFVG